MAQILSINLAIFIKLFNFKVIFVLKYAILGTFAYFSYEILKNNKLKVLYSWLPKCMPIVKDYHFKIRLTSVNILIIWR